MSKDDRQQQEPSEDGMAQFHCGTTAGDFEMIFYREWSPHGYDRVVQLLERGFYDHSHFFRVIHGFLAQFGISYSQDAALQTLADTPIPDDKQLDPPIPFDEGIISFAGSGPNSRTSHLFIAYGPVESFGQELWETPVGEVLYGMDNIRNLYGDYGDGEPDGDGPNQNAIHDGGEDYMIENFPNLDRFLECVRVPIALHIDKEQQENEEKDQNKKGNMEGEEVLLIQSKDGLGKLLRQRGVQKIESIKGVYKSFVIMPWTWGIIILSLLTIYFLGFRKARKTSNKVRKMN